MQIAKDKVVSFDYTLTDQTGEVIDSSDGSEPLAYVHGAGSIIPGLESALEGKNPGDKFQVSIAPERAYGERDDDLLQVYPREVLKGVDDIEVGMQFQAQTDQGMQVFTVVAVEGDDITLDGNHPLAGVTLNFDVTVVDVREATSEELAHGHVHDAHSHGH
jgi:FKBP-type peptidyl-prolyl cis-trans isomerase SlyD